MCPPPSILYGTNLPCIMNFSFTLVERVAECLAGPKVGGGGPKVGRSSPQKLGTSELW